MQISTAYILYVLLFQYILISFCKIIDGALRGRVGDGLGLAGQGDGPVTHNTMPGAGNPLGVEFQFNKNMISQILNCNNKILTMMSLTLLSKSILTNIFFAQ